MISRSWRMGITLTGLVVSLIPAIVRAQPTAYLTQWGAFGTGNGEFHFPAGVATDAAGDVYVADSQNHRIQKFTSAGNLLMQWGSYGTGEGQFNVPFGVTTDAAGNVYIADRGNNRIQKFTGTGAYVTQWGALRAAAMGSSMILPV